MFSARNCWGWKNFGCSVEEKYGKHRCTGGSGDQTAHDCEVGKVEELYHSA